VSHPKSPSDYRPISVTSILSRALETHIVKTYLYPALNSPPPDLNFNDQYAFRPTGSCTSAIIAILDSVTELLRSNDYVILVALDFSRAFDTVKHEALFKKFAKLDLNPNVYNWLAAYFDGREHTTTFQGNRSLSKPINASIVQGSGVGPFSYIVAASDLKPKSLNFKIHKYADDTFLVTAGFNHFEINDELDHVNMWAKNNNLSLNKAKIYEIIFTKRGCKKAPRLLRHPESLGLSLSQFSGSHFKPI